MFNIDRLKAIQALENRKAKIQINPSEDGTVILLVDGVKFTEETTYTEACDVLRGVADDGLSDIEEQALSASDKHTDSEFGECFYCGDLYMRNNVSQVTNHLDGDLNIDFDYDREHTAY